jgi:hypothetical protein
MPPTLIDRGRAGDHFVDHEPPSALNANPSV